ncbi:MAG: 4-alpha-glucanotransferase, partial [Verrucomicrobiota bacterium]
GNSPYQSLSSFAGNHLLIDLEELKEQALLSGAELEAFPEMPQDHVDFGRLIPEKMKSLKTACLRFDRNHEGYRNFCREEAAWLDDYALFISLKEAHDLRPWTEWPEEFGLRRGLDAARQDFEEEIEQVRILQFLFYRQWTRLKTYARDRRIEIIGDIPIFVAHDSCDVWSNPDLFDLDETGRPNVMAGVPPDYFCEDGQLWGNPLYRWERHRETGYAWWIQRISKMLESVDLIRLDHFRGFEAYWEVPGGSETARHGRWVKGPGGDFFAAIREALGGLPFVAEDLGLITDEVDALRLTFDLPGMKVLQFEFGEHEEGKVYPADYPENCVVYTGTHDNDTAIGWFREPPQNQTRSLEDVEQERARVRDLVGTDGSDIQWDLMALAMSTPARTSIVPLQDILGLGSSARMNIPGHDADNWEWRYTPDQFTDTARSRFRDLTLQHGRT